ncbi:hypothetical protein Ddye_018153 [Dipteronia dyeriana]|uniref:Uncharacterized protein n=1 Tax=Dipteronia dyeriana TaxID=168575 RepID=A0AAD9UAJ4_9ROSI|nr:hypothetical protein Ddye_018153 [Dipteronia dyeriana]
MNAPSDPPVQDGNSPYPYDVPPVLIAPLLLDEDSLNDDTNQDELQSSNKQILINTRSTAKLKPSRYKISPYIAGPSNSTTKYIYGPFRIGFPLNTYNEQLITYIFSRKLPASEVIIDIDHLRITRKCFRTLEPSKFDDSEMESLDIVLGDDILVAFPTTFLFASFNISFAKAPSQPNGFECGLLICIYMDDNCPTPLQMKLFQSQCQRLLARFLALFPGNNNFMSLNKSAQDHYNLLISNNEVLLLVNLRQPPIHNLRGKITTLLD